jgi:hypothetical protein
MPKEEAKKKLWFVLSQSKLGKPYCNPTEQYLSLLDIISRDSDRSLLIEANYYALSLTKLLKKQTWYDKMHKSKGGFVGGGDDAFYMDFPAWIVAQGEELFQEIQVSGRLAITDYIKKHGMSTKDVVYENLLYPFQEGIKALSDSSPINNEVTICFKVITSSIVPSVKELVVGDTKERVGYRLTYPLSFLYKGNVLSEYEVDIPLEALGKDIPLELSERSVGVVQLLPQGSLLVSESERQKGYSVHNVEDLGYTGALTAYLREINFIYGYLD